MWPFTKREHDCEKHGHKYSQRYDEMVDPRLTAHDMELMQIRGSKVPRLKLYVRDVCEHCGDCIERIEGKHPLEILARQAR